MMKARGWRSFRQAPDVVLFPNVVVVHHSVPTSPEIIGLELMSESPWFQRTFRLLSVEFKVVEVDVGAEGSTPGKAVSVQFED
jgi:hypothetical protein